MAVAEIIGAAVGVLLLVVVAYLLVGGTLATAETVITAQKEITLLQESRIRTSTVITSASTDGTTISYSLKNTGNEIITDLPHLDVFSYNATNGYTHYQYSKTVTADAGKWYILSFQDTLVHANALDPNVTLNGVAVLQSGDRPSKIQIITGNGVSAEKTI